MKRIWNIAFALLIGATIIGCGGDSGNAENGGDAEEKETITQKGSDTMVLLAQKWAEEYDRSHPGTQIQVTGGGSGTGIAALINGTTQIANASRPMKDEEKEQIKTKYGADPVEIAVAKDGITIYVHPDNAIEQLSIEQLNGIYSGTIKNWNEVGGNDAPIILYGRENSSGTYDFFKEHVLNKGDFATETQTLSGTAAVVHAVAEDKNGIGYGGAAYSKGIKIIKLAGADGTGLEPTMENVTSGAYPLSRDLYFYLIGSPVGATKEYVDWVLSDEGQKLTVKMEYFPVRAVASVDASEDGAATTN